MPRDYNGFGESDEKGYIMDFSDVIDVITWKLQKVEVTLNLGHYEESIVRFYADYCGENRSNEHGKE